MTCSNNALYLRVSALSLFFIFISCEQEQEQEQKERTLFQLLAPSETGIDFENQIFENDSLNILNQANLYNGGGVGIGDFNGDGLMDVYFAGNMVSNKLYLNKGDMKFEDITDSSNVGGNGHWFTGVSVIDINSDGWPDIYLSASFRGDPKLRTNLLYINEGADKKGIPTFKESAEAYGLADNGFGTQGYFFDYDLDGDLDMYQVMNEIYDPKTPIRYRDKLTDGSAKNTDRLYRNNGDGTFTNVSKEAGITIEGWGHAACITDINKDGWPDIYVANDFVANDLCYINNKNGTFTNRLGDYFKHSAWNAMGTDMVDFNNDGFPDMISLEMLPEDNLRKKRMLSGNEYYNYIKNAQYNYDHQYVRNVFQINSGPTPKGHPVFDDLAFMSGVYQTDWSWCPLVADFDNDGYRDMIITNGLPRDVTDMDYSANSNGQRGISNDHTLAMTDSLPILKVANYAYRNINGLQFEDTSKAWGLDEPSFSNGAAYGDLDNDGDLDVVINNINGPAFVYRNTLNKKGDKYLYASFEGSKGNIDGIGVNVQLFFNNGKQLYYEHYPIRGYLSTHDKRAYFGLGDVKTIDSLIVSWPDGKAQILKNLKVDGEITLSYDSAHERTIKVVDPFRTSIFKSANSKYGIDYKPRETDFADYNVQTTIPHKLSQYGPGIAIGDIDKNGFEDFYIGGSSDNPGTFFMQNPDGSFIMDGSRFLKKQFILYEDMGVLLFDADNDTDLDLYLVSGSTEIPPMNSISNDRFFLNNGRGKFEDAAHLIPADLTNGSCVRAADFDGDGDLDLFVGGRSVSGSYPTAPKSFLLKNEGGKFIDVTETYAPGLRNIGMVTDALWSDFDADGKPDLVLSGEWMAITFLKNTGSSLKKIDSGIEDRTGWWNSLTAGDFDGDGDMDYLAGNLGLNSNYKATPQEPMTLIAKDIDGNRSIDPMVFCYIKGNDGKRRPYPMASFDDLASQVPKIGKQYPTYKSYGLATMDDLWPETYRKDALVLKATEMRSSYIENKGNGRFAISALPLEAQVAPVYGMKSEDLDGDRNLDILLVGNDYGMDPYSGRHDAFSGLCLKGDGKGSFKPMLLTETGFFVDGDAKALATLHTAKKEDVLIATQNQGELLIFNRNNGSDKDIEKWIDLKPDDFSADILYRDGSKRHIEFYYGSTYLSQSSRKLPIDKNTEEITITNFKGIQRLVHSLK